MRTGMLIVIVIGLWGGLAHAGDKATAEFAFQQGKDLMKAGKYADACAAFEKSQAADPQFGTEYNLATCYEKLGKLASAWGAFRELAQRDTNSGRKADSDKRASALQPRLIKLLISVRAPVAGLKVTRNGDDVSASVGIESPVDPGDYEIGAVADGYKPWSVKVSAKQEGGTVQVTVPELEKLPEAVKPAGGDRDLKPLPPGPGDHVVASSPATKSRKGLGMIVGGGGLAVTAVGLVFGYEAMSKHSDAKNLCGGSIDPCANQMNLAAANTAESSAKSWGTMSTITVGVGAAALIAGAVIYFTSPADAPATESTEHAWRVVPTATPDGFALTATGTF